MADPTSPPDPPPAPAGVSPSLDEPEIEALIQRFRVPPREAQRILDRVTFTLLAKRERIRDPRRWLLRALRRQCLDWWRRRRRLLARVLDSGLTILLATPSLPEGERRFLTEEIERHLRLLRPECRRLLARRYGLDLGEEGAEEEGDATAELACVETLARRLGEA